MIEMQKVESSQLDSVGHDPESNTLQIRFKGRGDAQGSLYRYRNVSANDFVELVSAESVDKHFKEHIKSAPEQYPFEKVVESDLP